MRGDGDGWTFGDDGARYWGRFGAAGLLLCAPLGHSGGSGSGDSGSGSGDSGADETVVLLQHRAIWSHQGGTWGLPGGARDSHESPEEAAVREANEEAGITPGDVTVVEALVTHRAQGWTYTTVIARAPHPVATVGNGESAELRWVRLSQVADLPLHPGLAKSWPDLLLRLV